MSVRLRTIIALVRKELTSLIHDRFLMGFVVFAFTAMIYLQATGNSQEIRNASVAIADEDRSELSRRIASAFQPPLFKAPQMIDPAEIDRLMGDGKATFALDIPPNFEAELLSGKSPSIQLLVDATAMSQAGLGASQIQSMIEQEVRDFRRGRTVMATAPPLELRNAFNQSLVSTWFTGVVELLDNTTMLAILLAGAAIVREREHGTLEHLLVMPVRPVEIMTAKIVANGLVIAILAAIALRFVLQGLLGLQVAGSSALFLFGVVSYLFFAGSLGIFLGTVSRSMPQLSLLFMLTVLPMSLLSGGNTPREAMPEWLQNVMSLSPSTHYVAFTQAVLLRGADLSTVWPHLMIITMIGLFFFGFSLSRFRRFLAAQN